jgi:hypothetical protein
MGQAENDKVARSGINILLSKAKNTRDSLLMIEAGFHSDSPCSTTH